MQINPVVTTLYETDEKLLRMGMTGVQISGRPWQPKCHLGDLKT
jgi:hypothetical protein